METKLTSIYPVHWKHFQTRSYDTELARCRAYYNYVDNHTVRYRQELNKAKVKSLIFNLHEAEAGLLHELRWIQKVVAAYEFHQRSALRQKEELQKQLGALKEGTAIAWLDWKQNVTLPLAYCATGDQYWATARMEASVLGFILFEGKQGSPPAKTAVILITDVIEHTALAATLQFEELVRPLLPSNLKQLHIWADVGPHFRCWDFVAYINKLASTSRQTSYTINFFAEKHGKGQVDALFGSVNRWLDRATRVPGTSIEDLASLVATLQAQAAQDEKADPPPAGCRYIVKQWESAKKPRQVQKASSSEVQIRKTYAFSATPGPAKRVLWKNHGFSDSVAGTAFSLQVWTETLDDTVWRRGHYSNPQWKRSRSFPQKGDRSGVMDRAEALKSLDRAVAPSRTERRLARYQSGLAKAKDRRKRQRLLRKPSAASQSDSSSTTSSSSSSSDSSADEA